MVAILHGTRTLVGDMGVHEEGSVALLNLACSSSNKMGVILAGSDVDVIMVDMQVHGSAAQVQENVAGALWILATGATT